MGDQSSLNGVKVDISSGLQQIDIINNRPTLKPIVEGMPDPAIALIESDCIALMDTVYYHIKVRDGELKHQVHMR
ncbi:MAG TPA: hypothetical protein VFH67_03950 [bacterium]|nr:hypothetical protein [bacterium]